MRTQGHQARAELPLQPAASSRPQQLITNNPHLFGENACGANTASATRVRCLPAATRTRAEPRGIRAPCTTSSCTIPTTAITRSCTAATNQARLFGAGVARAAAFLIIQRRAVVLRATEVRDIYGYLKLLREPDNDSRFLRVVNTPARNRRGHARKALGYARAERKPVCRILRAGSCPTPQRTGNWPPSIAFASGSRTWPTRREEEPPPSCAACSQTSLRYLAEGNLRQHSKPPRSAWKMCSNYRLAHAPRQTGTGGRTIHLCRAGGAPQPDRHAR